MFWFGEEIPGKTQHKQDTHMAPYPGDLCLQG